MSDKDSIDSRTYTVTELYEAATYAVYGKGHEVSKHEVAQALAERLGLTIRPELPESVEWDPLTGVIWSTGRETIPLDLSGWSRRYKNESPGNWERFSFFLAELSRCYNTIRQMKAYVQSVERKDGRTSGADYWHLVSLLESPK